MFIVHFAFSRTNHEIDLPNSPLVLSVATSMCPGAQVTPAEDKVLGQLLDHVSRKALPNDEVQNFYKETLEHLEHEATSRYRHRPRADRRVSLF